VSSYNNKRKSRYEESFDNNSSKTIFERKLLETNNSFNINASFNIELKASDLNTPMKDPIVK
jgi:hypothetical protein